MDFASIISLRLRSDEPERLKSSSTSKAATGALPGPVFNIRKIFTEEIDGRPESDTSASKK